MFPSFCNIDLGILPPRGQPQLSPLPPMGQIRGYVPPNAQQGGQLRPPVQGMVYAITQG